MDDINSNKIFTIKNKFFIVKEIEDEFLSISYSIGKKIEMFVKPLFKEYHNYLLNCGVDLSFQDFDNEFVNLPGVYSKEKKGNILLIFNFEHFENNLPKDPIPAGMVSLKDLDNNICEMKRLFIVENFRGYGLGRILMNNIIDYAKKTGYIKIRWDSLKKLQGATFLYERYKYKLIQPYNYNPFDDVVYYEIDL
jgi:GNAT superfamily N-acetyltransferase